MAQQSSPQLCPPPLAIAEFLMLACYIGLEAFALISEILAFCR